jgi:hypothetical protein
MKTKTYLLFVLVIYFGMNIHCKTGKRSGSANISFIMEESEDHFSIFADYDPANTKKVESVLDKYLKESNDPSFMNTKLDADLTLRNRTVFHIKHNSGELEIELDKDKNPGQTIQTFKKMAEELKRSIL